MKLTEDRRKNLLSHIDDMDACGWKDDAKTIRELLAAHPDHSGDGGEKVANILAEFGNSEHPCTEAAAVPQDGGEKAAAHVTLPAPDTTHYAQWAGDTIKYHSDDQIYEFASARVKAALASNKAAAHFSDHTVQAWAERHDIKLSGNDLRAAFDDAASSQLIGDA